MEIKQTVLNPFGAREELINSTSGWTHGGGVIGSPSVPEPDLPTDVTTNWIIAQYGAKLFLMNYAWSLLPSDLRENPSDYQVVITDIVDPIFSAVNGTYAITAAVENGPGSLFDISGLVLPVMQQSIASTDGFGGSISIVHAGSNITIPAPNAGETASQWAARVTQLGLVTSFVSSVPNSLGAEYNNKLEQSSPAVGTAVAPGSTVNWWSYAEYVAPGTVVTLTTSSVVSQSTQGMTVPLKGRATLVNVVGGEEGGPLFTAAASNGLVGKTVTFSSDVNGTPGADGGELSYFAGQTFTITYSNSMHQNEIPGMFPASDRIFLEWTASGPNYGFGQFTAGTATISA